MQWILASASPRRKELLKEIIPDFAVIPATGEENNAPAIAAGVVVGALSTGLFALWVRKKWPDWKED